MAGIFAFLGLFSAGGVILLLACLFYGVNPIQATAMLSADVQAVMVVIPWLFLAYAIARWLRYVELRSRGKAKRKDEYPFANIAYIFCFAIFTVFAVKGVRYIFGAQ